MAENDVVLGPERRELPEGRFLLFRHPTATHVAVAGSWDVWSAHHALRHAEDAWTLDVSELLLRPGRFEYKFIVDGGFEFGSNRVLYADCRGLMMRPPDFIEFALLEGPTSILARLKERPKRNAPFEYRFEPTLPIREATLLPLHQTAGPSGYVTSLRQVQFVFRPEHYGLESDAVESVDLAGTFNHWHPRADGDRWRMQRHPSDTVWTLDVPRRTVQPAAADRDIQFKFVLNGHQWLAPPPGAESVALDDKGHVNLRWDAGAGKQALVRLTTAEPVDYATSYVLYVALPRRAPAWKTVSPSEALMDTWVSHQPMGATLDREQGCTTYRLFAPRARSVTLCLYDGPYFERPGVHPQGPPEPIEPAERHPMQPDRSDGTWSHRRTGLNIGQYYAFLVEGPEGDGEGVDPHRPVGDPYARAAARAPHSSIVVDPEATNPWFRGWTDVDWQPPAPESLVIYETHVRGLTAHPSSHVPDPLKGKFAGIAATLGTGRGLDHLRGLGINAIELLPVAEFRNEDEDYDWGYNSAFFFAPHSSYGRSPLEGSSYYEFKQMVDDLHREGFAVLLDVVYNHIGSPNVFAAIDRKYYFRLNPDHTYINFSGCGNDTRSEAPMFRRLMVDSVIYWMREHHVDGFRFDLAELIDRETLRQVEQAARAENPDVILISEPWSFRGNHKGDLRGTTWAAWNDDFRNAGHRFLRGEPNRDLLREVINGSLNYWVGAPPQSVNYLESHDDMALADLVSASPNRDASHLSVRDQRTHLLGAALLLTSLGVPMLAEGQEFLRSKRGIRNTYGHGDEINAVDWTRRDEPLAREALAWYRDLIALRQCPAGASFRLRERPPPEYLRWICPDNGQALGYIVNCPKQLAGAGFIVLLNGSLREELFVVDLPEGTWTQIADGRRIAPDGLPGKRPVRGPGSIRLRVPRQSVYIYMDGF